MQTCANCNNVIDGNYCYFCERLIIGNNGKVKRTTFRYLQAYV